MSAGKDADFHMHRCEWCATTFSHRKSLIKKGCGHLCHVCPGCKKDVNVRLPLTESEALRMVVEFDCWYGVGSVGLFRGER